MTTDVAAPPSDGTAAHGSPGLAPAPLHAAHRRVPGRGGGARRAVRRPGVGTHRRLRPRQPGARRRPGSGSSARRPGRRRLGRALGRRLRPRGRRRGHHRGGHVDRPARHEHDRAAARPRRAAPGSCWSTPASACSASWAWPSPHRSTPAGRSRPTVPTSSTPASGSTSMPGRPYEGGGCFADSALVEQGDLVLLGAGQVLTNDQVLRADNAAVALRLLGQDDHLIWYVPTYDDLVGDDGVDVWSLLPDWIRPGLWLLLVAGLVLVVLAGPAASARSRPSRCRSWCKAIETTRSRGRLYRRRGDRAHAAGALRAAARSRAADTAAARRRLRRAGSGPRRGPPRPPTRGRDRGPARRRPRRPPDPIET